MSEKTRILVVDDEEIVCVSVRRILSREGCEVDSATTAARALDLIDDHEYQLIITDLMMPEMNGIEMMHSMRVRGLEIPFLMITGYPTIRTAMQALRLGAIDYIPKPFTRKELLGPVNRALRRRGVREGAASLPGGEGRAEQVRPGDKFILPEHSWAVYNQDGMIDIGIEASFLESAGKVVKVETPAANEMIEQGYPTIRLGAADGDEHGVFAPFSGRVVEVNQEVIDAPEKLGPEVWVLRVVPSSLRQETVMLNKER